MKRAKYKCLDDLVEEGLHPSILVDLDNAEKFIKMIHGKESLA